MAEVLAENEELFFEPGAVVLEDHDVVDALLQLLLVLLLERVHVEHEQVPVVAADPRQLVVHEAAEQPVARCLPDYLGL